MSRTYQAHGDGPAHLRLVGDGGTSSDRPVRIPPNDLASEAVLLGSMIMDRRHRATIRHMVTADTLYGADNRIVYRAVCELDDRNELDGDPDVAIVVLAGHLRDRQLIQRAGGARRLGELVSATAATSQVETLCRRVIDSQRLRRAIQATALANSEAYGAVAHADPQGWLQDVATALQQISDDGQSAGIATANDAVAEAVAHVERSHADDGAAERGMDLPWLEMTAQTCGLFLGESVAVTAKTGGGKSLLAGHVAEYVAETSGRAVGIWSLEMPRRQLISRMAVSRSCVSAHALRQGRLNESEMVRYRMALDELRSLPLFFDEWRPRRGWRTVESILATMARYAQQCPAQFGKPLGLMILDFIQKLDCSGVADRRASRENQLNIASDMIVREAERLNIALIMLGQTNEDGDIREAKSIAHHCHAWWKLEIKKQRAGNWTGEIHIAKQRHGAGGRVSFGFDPHCIRFHD